MDRTKRGFTLIASLLLLMMMSGLAIGLLMMVNTEARVGGNDLENNLAYHDSEGAMEKMTSDLSTTFQNIQSPKPGDITSLGQFPPTDDPAATYPDYTLTPALNPDGTLASAYGQVHSGSNEGLYAQIIPITLHATAQRPLGDQVSMYRTVEVALIPVFQFGVFSDSDLGFFNSPNLDFNGRVHTNGDLYLGVSSCCSLNFHDKMTAYGNVVRQVLPNGLGSSNYSNTGTVYIPDASQGCDMLPNNPPPGKDCKTIALTEGSVVAGPTSAQNGGWNGVSTGKFNSFILDGNYGNKGGTGAKALTLPFTSGGAQPFEIIRRPPKTEDPSSAIGQSRLGNLAAIRVMLSDDPNDLHLFDWNGDATQDIQLSSKAPACLINGGSGFMQNGVVIGGLTYYLGEAKPSTDANWLLPPTFHGAPFPVGCNSEWPLIDGYLLVEVKETDGKWHGVTQQWLNLGFARDLVPPNSEAGIANTIHQNAILLFQLRADRNFDGKISAADGSITTSGANSQYNWLPINFYDAREGEVRDVATGDSTCTPNGVMNAVELDVGNLKSWLKSNATGKLVASSTQNGYILFFSDRRGMQKDPNAAPPQLIGEYGFEDVVNSGNGAVGTPDGALEAKPPGKNQSPEDPNNNGRLDSYGATNAGDAFGINTNGAPRNPYQRMANCSTTGRKNRVTGARRALKLVNGTLGNLPVKPDGTGGFTIASENAVYIQGNYNSNIGDPTWNDPSAADPAHSAAAIIADAVILLSNSWQDAFISGKTGGSLKYPTGAWNNRPASTTYYRVAIAAGKNINFPAPTFSQTSSLYGFGTDGGVHNFLRFLEAWDNGSSLYYKGSLVSLFYSTYNTGTFKCCGDAVYHPPDRHYTFDPLFSQPQNLPPGTPMFRDVDNLSYRQDFTPH